MLPRAARGEGALPRRCRSVIVLLLEGGMSQFESWDPKPDAPAEIRGSFDSIGTNNPDLVVGEHMPRLAQQADLYNIVRSVYADNQRNDHSPGLHWVLTGHDNQAAGVSLMKDNKEASVGSVVAHQRGGLTADGLPNFVAIPNAKQLGGRTNFNQALHLGAGCEAFASGAVPAQADGKYVVPAGLCLPQDISAVRLSDRRRLLRSIDQAERGLERLADRGLSRFQEQAYDLLLGAGGRRAFDINDEPPAVRERYGDTTMGQGTLLARRLVEAGVNYVVVNLSKNNSWDSHSNNFERHKKMLPQMDQAASALLADLADRGLLDDVLVLMLGEMGRTPRINKNSGRDHWTHAWSVMMAGGGLTSGQVLGSTTRHGEQPAARPVHLQEILGTVYHQLGIDPELMLPDRFGRPVRILPEAQPIHEIIRRRRK